jgi:nucleoid DNA-binding protein
MASNRLTKSQIVEEMATRSGLTKKDVQAFFEVLDSLVAEELRKPDGEFVLPGLLKIRAVRKAATTDRQGINPFTKETMTIKGKPASTAVRASALKVLKDAVN